MEHIWLAIWKSLLLYLLLLVLTRVIGKKLLSQLTYLDFIIGITIGTISGAYVVERVKGAWVLLSPVILVIFTFLTAMLTTKNLAARKLIEGEPVVIIQNGKILEKNMSKLRYHLDHLQMQLRERGVFDIGEVEFAVLEPHGQLSVLKKTPHLPVTLQDLGIATRYQGLSTAMIKDGDVMAENLRQNNLSWDWLYRELRKQQIESLDDVVYAELNSKGELYIDRRNDR